MPYDETDCLTMVDKCSFYFLSFSVVEVLLAVLCHKLRVNIIRFNRNVSNSILKLSQSHVVKSRWFSPDDGVCLFCRRSPHVCHIYPFSDMYLFHSMRLECDINLTLRVFVEWPKIISKASSNPGVNLMQTRQERKYHISIEICLVIAIFCVTQYQYKSIRLFRFRAIKLN